MEAIDRVSTEAMIYAEKNCKSLCMGEVDYSPDVNKARGLKYVWQLVVKHLSGQNVKPDKIWKVAIAVGIQGDTLHSSITLGDACHAFNSMDDWLYKVNVPMMRVDFLREKPQDGAIAAAARKQAKISLGHEVQHDNACRMQHVQGKQWQELSQELVLVVARTIKNMKIKLWSKG
jgi:hypothetical protein